MFLFSNNTRYGIYILFISLFLSDIIFAQPPMSFKYQAVLRDATGQVLANQSVEIGVAILQGSVSGVEVFSETHATTTNSFGLATLEIGSIDPAGFESIDWAIGPYFVQVSVDGAVMGTSQLLSVPFALHAVTVENDNVDDADADPTNELQTWGTLPDIPADIADGDDVDDADADPTNELQTWGTLPDIPADIADGDDVDDADADPTNELQTWGTLPDIPADIADGDDVDDADTDPTNELQTWVTLPDIPADIADGDDVDDADADPANELQILSIKGDTIFLTNGGFVKLPAGFDGQYSSLSGTPENLSEFSNDVGYITSPDDADADPANELQSWGTLPGIPADIADGDDVDDADADPTNELQAWGTLPDIPADIADGDDVDDADADPTNELQAWGTLPGIPADIADGDDVDDADADPTNELQTWGTLPDIPADIADGDDVDDADADPTNELQSWGTLPDIPADIADGDDVDDADADPTNELQSWGTLPDIPADIADGDDVDDADADPTNELQSWGTLPDIPADIADGDDVDDADADPTNELQAWGTLPGIPADIADGDDVDDADADPTNELQTWGTLPGIPADIADGDDVDDADADTTNELQDISLDGTDLSITGGSTVDLSVVQDGTGTDDQTLSLVDGKIYIEDGNYVALPREFDPQVGANSLNYVPVWDGWQLAKGTIYDNGNIGIGTNTPGAKLEVAGHIKITGGNPGAGKILTSDTNGLATWEEAGAETDPQVGANTANYLPKWDGSALITGTVYDNGNIGIGTTSPDYKLQVDGDIAPETDGNRNLGSNTLGWDTLFMSSTIDYKSDLGFSSGGQEKVTITTDGKVGIGETDPDATLEIRLPTNDNTSSVKIMKNNGTSVFKVNGAGQMAGDGSGLSNIRGLANTVGGNFSYDITCNYGTYNNVRSVTITTPSSGKCFVMASGYIRWESKGWDLLLASILRNSNPNNSWDAENEFYRYLNLLTDYNCSDSSDQYTSFAQHRCFNVGTGTQTFTLWANKYTSSALVRVDDVNLSVLFFPTSGSGPASVPMLKTTQLPEEVQNYDFIEGSVDGHSPPVSDESPPDKTTELKMLINNQDERIKELEKKLELLLQGKLE